MRDRGTTGVRRDRRRSPVVVPGAGRPPWVGLVLLGLLGGAAAYAANLPCRIAGWRGGVQFTYGCYTDIHPLFFRDGLAEGTLVYVDQPVEYPVLTGAWMQLAAGAVSWIPDDRLAGGVYFDLTVVALTVCLVATVVMVGAMAGRDLRGGAARFDPSVALLAGAGVALVPATVLNAFINWDFLAIALATGALFLWQRDRPWLAGALLGLAVAAKFYPVFFLGPLLVLGLRDWWRDRDGGATLRDVARCTGAAVVAWAVVNLPVLLASPTGWATFFVYSGERGADWGTIYYVLGQAGVGWARGGETLNTVGTLGFLVGCVAVGALALFARNRPPLAALVFLTVAAFILTNKVWSPQFVLWLLPLAALAWPRNLRTWMVVAAIGLWQMAELGYALGIWPYLDHVTRDSDVAATTVTLGGYAVLTLGRFCGLILACAVVCAGCLRRPSHPTVAGSLRAD
ncbi:DUF2029 domain-containing protein [Spiractinospora alimapuensis]|uniref:glycosyltransferase family 87 protein n=1 Tax=Spiractinospora alimapuensis TaxID=2820884 RepID=UPI001F41BDBB|nr:glycosyltransferase 87 family protein [Spiractinospora alimapuensis]QVQ50518.1 DUF2029 domain-containing protein [Spiractinospora alimapuensis]